MNSRMMDNVRNSITKENLGTNIVSVGALFKIETLMSYGYKITFEDDSFEITKIQVQETTYRQSMYYDSFNNSSVSNLYDCTSYKLDTFDKVVDETIEKEDRKAIKEKEEKVVYLKEQIASASDKLENLKNELNYME